MKLPFDENLSHHLVHRLADLFPGSLHVRDVGLKTQGDEQVWNYAASHGLVVVSKDEDFHHLSFVRGAPPKVIGVQTGNCSADSLERLLRSNHAEILSFAAEPQAAFLPLR